MTSLIESFEALDGDLAKGVGVEVSSALLLQEIEAGSIITWLRNSVTVGRALGALRTTPEAIERYLVVSKGKFMSYIGSRQTVRNREEVQQLQRSLRQVAAETMGDDIWAHHAPSDTVILENLNSIGSALANLREFDRVSFMLDGESHAVSPGFQINEETVEQLLTREKIANTNQMILKVKKPDLLGDSRWEFKHQRANIEANIGDAGWLARFRAKEELIAPGDALKALVRTEVLYGHDGDVLRTRHHIEEVLGVIRDQPDRQTSLLP